MTNEERVNKIKKLLGLVGEDTKEEYYRVADVLCDLRHFCDAEFIDFKDEVEQSEFFYEEEKEAE
tara:strand:- start:29 stop:223 length:195 start_codon:yes stop_codon:yes gene_type:complete